MARFSIGMVGYGKNPHTRCFEDFARALADALRTLGHEYVQIHDANPGRLIMFGANNMTDPIGRMPADAIVFNTEQVSAVRDPRYFMESVEKYKKHVVWDYSRANIDALKKIGLERVVHCPLGYVPSMARISRAADQDIDVLYYGSVNPQRLEILDALDRTELRVARVFGIYGDERDAFIARSKIVLNIHHYPRAVFEIFRVSHLLANHVAVVSEDGGRDAELEAFARRATAYVSRDRIVEECRRLVADDAAREEHAERGFAEFSKIDLVENVRRALLESKT